ncbi:MAG: hypothetical protein ACI3XO_03555, partial [Eubacteriales bacterium]
ADNAYGSSEKLDYAGLISRAEKYQLTFNNVEGSFGWWTHRVLLDLYPANIGAWELYPQDNYSSYDDYKKSSDYETIQNVINSDGAKTGYPYAYYYVRIHNVKRSDFELRMTKYCDDKYASLITDAIYSENTRVIIETLMSPEMVVDPTAYNSDKPKRREYDTTELWGKNIITFNFEDIFLSPYDIIELSLETLDGWNYSDEFWYDYYCFIEYLNNIPYENQDSIAVRSSFTNSAEKKAELARRLALYSERVGKSPDTGDEGGARVAFLSATTVLVAIIPAGVLTVWRRRKIQA